MPFATTENCVAAAERELNVVLPAEYRQRLTSVNGGGITTAGDDWLVFPVKDDTDASRAEQTRNHLVVQASAARSEKSFPVDALAIASNSRGDLLVLLKAEGAVRLDGRVHVWDRATGQLRPTALDFT
jgi:hypothetical protein